MAHLQKLSPLLTLLLLLALGAGCTYQGSLAPVSCDGPADCPSGSSCIEGICELDLTDVDDQDTEQEDNSDTDEGTEDINGEDPVKCPDNRERCGDECVDLINDPLHCGECHNNCLDLPLATGLCIDRTCETECAEDLDRCGVYCVDLTDNYEHCGACNHTCSDNEACFQSQCLPACDPTLSPFGGGEGTEDTPFVICAPHQLQAITSEYLASHFILVKPIDLDELGQPFEPIAPTNEQQFSGTFDGSGLAIKNLSIPEGNNESGLFGVVASEGILKNILLQGGEISGGDRSGALVGINNGTISNSHIKDISISGPRVIGGLVGRNDGEIHDSSAVMELSSAGDRNGGLVGFNRYGTITGSSASGTIVSSGEKTGGLVGENHHQIIDSLANTSVTSSQDQVGGLVGFNQNGTITGSSASGTIVSSGEKTGGLVGENRARILDSFADSEIVSSNEIVGGLVGLNSGEIRNSHAQTQITGDGDDAYNLGGLVGSANGDNTCQIFQSSAAGNIQASESIKRAGGLVGFLKGDCTVEQSFASTNIDALRAEHVGGLVGRSEKGTILNSYTTGTIKGDENVGGLGGRVKKDSTFQNCYSLSPVVGRKNVNALFGDRERAATVINSYGSSEASNQDDSGGGSLLTPDQFQDQNQFTDWDFEEIWRMSDPPERPRLQWESP